MHDPLVLGSRVLTIWHVDPEKRGDDDSCDWFGHHRPLNMAEKDLLHRIDALSTILDNPPFYPDHEAHKRFGELNASMRRWLRRGRRIHPRWHIHHWRLQFPWLQLLRRSLFDRCNECGGRYPLPYYPVVNWKGGKEGTRHHDCANVQTPKQARKGRGIKEADQ